MAWFSPFYDLHNPNVPSSLGHGVPAAVKLAPTHYFHLPHKDQSVQLHQWILGVLSLHIKNPEREARNSPLSGATFKSSRSCNLSPLPDTSLWNGA